MYESPQNGWLPILCWVEKVRHPIECVETIFGDLKNLNALTRKGEWHARTLSLLGKLSGAEAGGWKLPPVLANWKQMLETVIEDVAENTGNRVLIMLDEFPLMIANIMDAQGPGLAMEFLDTLRAIRQRFEPSGKVRFILSGSIGLHLIVQDLKANHNYRNNPTNDMAALTISGMCEGDVCLMCKKYLEEESIRRDDIAAFDQRMLNLTDGLPLWIQYVCERFQAEKRKLVTADDIDLTLRQMMDNPEVQWFDDAAKRIETYYSRLGVNKHAALILKMLSNEQGFVSERKVIDFLRSQITVEMDDTVVDVLKLLRDDHYLKRNTESGERCYCFRYRLMREWWKVNRG